MKNLTWWYRIVGVVYLLLGISWLPFLTTATMSQKIPRFDAPVGGAAWNGFADWMLVFGLDLLVLGVFLLIGSRRPWAWLPVFWMTIVLGLVRGIADDVYMILRGYPAIPLLVFILLHTTIIVWGLLAWRRARGAIGVEPASGQIPS